MGDGQVKPLGYPLQCLLVQVPVLLLRDKKRSEHH
jgi:hypothetical protein